MDTEPIEEDSWKLEDATSAVLLHYRIVVVDSTGGKVSQKESRVAEL